MKNFLFYLFGIFTFHLINLNAQVTQEWVARYNGTGGAYSIAVDALGYVYVTGGSDDSYVTIKYNFAGAEQWVAIYNGPENEDDAESIAVDDLGNVYVSGSSSGLGSGSDYATVKYNSSGIQQWVARYNGPNNTKDEVRSMVIDESGNIYVTGHSAGIGTGSDFATVKYNSSGIQQWVARYNGPGNASDVTSSIKTDISGNVYITGSSIGSGAGFEFASIKYNSNGVQQWVARYNGSGNGWSQASSLVMDVSGNIYVTGYSFGSGSAEDYATIKYNSFGAELWVARYNGTGNSYDYAKSIAIDNAGYIYVTGYSFGSGSGSDYATIKYNSLGVEQWVQRYKGTGNSYDYAKSIAIDNAGDIYVTGSSVGRGSGSDYATIKYNSLGVEQWVQRYNGSGDSTDEARSLALDGSGNVYVTGSSVGSGTGSDYATIKYSQSVGINQISSTVPEQFNLLQNYPNPFNPTTNIEFSLLEKSFVILKVFDITGKEVADLVNENLSAGTFRYEFNAGNLASGLYFYKLVSSKFSETKKMIILK